MYLRQVVNFDLFQSFWRERALVYLNIYKVVSAGFPDTRVKLILDLDVFLFFCLKLKVVAIDENLTVIHQNNVQFDSELPEFR